MQINSSHLLIDACCIINLCASGELLNILQAIQAQSVIVEEVKRELLDLDNIDQFDNAIAKNFLLIVDFESNAEMETFVNYTADLNDGEAGTGAIAIHRNWAMATDDKKAIKFLSQASPALQMISTPEIIKFWSEASSVPSMKLSQALQKIQTQARYLPPKHHPLKSWWETTINVQSEED